MWHRIGRDWSGLVRIGLAWSGLAEIGRDWSGSVGIGRDRSGSVGTSRDRPKRYHFFADLLSLRAAVAGAAEGDEAHAPLVTLTRRRTPRWLLPARLRVAGWDGRVDAEWGMLGGACAGWGADGQGRGKLGGAVEHLELARPSYVAEEWHMIERRRLRPVLPQHVHVQLNQQPPHLLGHRHMRAGELLLPAARAVVPAWDDNVPVLGQRREVVQAAEQAAVPAIPLAARCNQREPLLVAHVVLPVGAHCTQRCALVRCPGVEGRLMWRLESEEKVGLLRRHRVVLQPLVEQRRDITSIDGSCVRRKRPRLLDALDALSCTMRPHPELPGRVRIDKHARPLRR